MTEIPEEIALALFATAEAVATNPLVKDMQNEFAKFKYVPIDSYYAAIPPLALKNGLFWRCRETEVGSEGKTFMFRYAFDLIHEGGATVEGYDIVTIYHPAQGPQSSGSARSYADKLFMRTAFKCVTGEKDSEYFHKDETEDFDIGDADATDNSDEAVNAEQLKDATKMKVKDDPDPAPALVPAPKGKDATKMNLAEWREGLLGHPENPVSIIADGNGVAEIAAPENSEGANLIMKTFEVFMPRINEFDSSVDCIKALRDFYSTNETARKALEELGKEHTTKLLANFKAAKVAATNGEIWEEGK